MWPNSIGTGMVWLCKSYPGCHINVDTLVSRRIHPEPGFGCDNQWVCVHVWTTGIMVVGKGTCEYLTFPRAVRRLGEFEQIGSSGGRLESEPIQSVRIRYLRPCDGVNRNFFFLENTRHVVKVPRTEATSFYLYMWVVDRYKRMESTWVHGVTKFQLSIEQTWTS